VDGKVRLSSREKVGEADKLVFEVQGRSLCGFIAAKGSVAIDGVSLTVNGVSADRFDVVIIPHTLEVTTLGSLATGHEANLEVDLLARYVARLLSVGADTGAIASKDESLRDLLKTAGFV
jgi:riboflavin synthase